MKVLSPESLDRLARFLWATTLVALPVTSFRFMPFMGSDSQVRPLSFIPAVLLLLLLVLKSFQQRQFLFWNNSLLALIIFSLAAILSSVAGFLLAPINLYQYSYESRLLRAWITVGVGLVFFLVSIGMNRNENDLEFSLKWLYLGFAAQVAWSLVQLVAFYAPRIFPGSTLGSLVGTIQKTLMVSGLPVNNRISGLTLEPSWLAAQMVTLYLPWALAAIFKGYQWSHRRWLAPTILLACIVLLLFTYSRSGILIALAAAILTFLAAGFEKVRQAWLWLVSPLRPKYARAGNRILGIGVRTALIIVLLAGLAGGITALSRNKYISQVWQAPKTDLVGYFVNIYAGPRLAYAWAGWTVFEQHPWVGVGLGAAGFYLIEALPDWSHFNMLEIARLLSPTNTVYPNTKNLYIRLLAETGFLGFWAFISFYLFMLGKALAFLRSHRKEIAFLGTASLMAIMAIIALGFSQDSFAMANVWLPLGILVGIANSTISEVPEIA